LQTDCALPVDKICKNLSMAKALTRGSPEELVIYYYYLANSLQDKELAFFTIQALR
jgi:hypothetical protein